MKFPSAAKKKFFQLNTVVAVLFAPLLCSGSQLDCRSKSAYVVAKIKSEYYEQIPNETIEFAKNAAMEMCLSNKVETQQNGSARTKKHESNSQPQKKSFLGIKFGSSERKEGNKRLLDKK